jgi:nitrite reductase/ring-hydroxylating ferredoxin subunit
MTNFKIGQKVVCIDDSTGWVDGEKSLVKGEIYTILDICSFKKGDEIRVVYEDGFWHSSRFRPLKRSLLSNKEIIEEKIDIEKEVEVEEN